jgi:hypothetical protein
MKLGTSHIVIHHTSTAAAAAATVLKASPQKIKKLKCT